jgi:hypothetical protein
VGTGSAHSRSGAPTRRAFAYQSNTRFPCPKTSIPARS